MKTITIENWNQYGDYLFFDDLVKKANGGKSMFVTSTSSKLTIMYKELEIRNLMRLLSVNNIIFTEQ